MRALPYQHGVAEAIVLALDAADGDPTGLINVIALLSTAGVSRVLLYAAGQQGLLEPSSTDMAAEPERIDEALGRLASASLLTFSVDDATRRHAKPSYPVKTEPAFEDMLTQLRRVLITARISKGSVAHLTPEQTKAVLAAWHAAAA